MNNSEHPENCSTCLGWRRHTSECHNQISAEPRSFCLRHRRWTERSFTCADYRTFNRRLYWWERRAEVARETT
jgi:hypothetical protein